jgi:hypothetical protein
MIVLTMTAIVLVSCTGDQEQIETIQPTGTPTPPAISVGSSREPLCPQVEIPTETQSPQEQDESEIPTGPFIMTHFMPWYVAPPISNDWGWHWTMNHFSTHIPRSGEIRQIASHYYPLTGPYDSMDDDVLAYQVLLMKLGGIDGAIVDWYGSFDHAGYIDSHERTSALFEHLEAAGLQFAICYEDQTVGHLISGGNILSEEAITRAQEDMLIIQDLWLQDSTYLRLDGQPVLLNFGPQYFRTNSEWLEIFSVFNVPPKFFTLDGRIGHAAVGAFNWPPMHESYGGELSRSVLERQLADFYFRASYWDHFVASAYPGFHDIYEQAGVRESYGFLDASEGETFAFTLEQAFSHNPDVIQLVTWNDYGEGTIIEPTVEFGYRYLEMVQDARRSWIDPDFPFNADDLRIPLQIFELRQSYAANREVLELLDTAYDLALHGDTQTASALLECISTLP